MNAAFFGAKRVFHGGLRILRKRLEAVAPGLTSARFDMMFALTSARRGRSIKRVGKVLMQREVREILGVCGPVVSRMLRSLERLGWISRTIEPFDRRQRSVSLTATGLQIVEEAYRRLFLRLRRFVFRVLSGSDYRRYLDRLGHMETFERYQDRLRKKCRDTASLYYSYGHPDD